LTFVVNPPGQPLRAVPWPGSGVAVTAAPKLQAVHRTGLISDGFLIRSTRWRRVRRWLQVNYW